MIYEFQKSTPKNLRFYVSSCNKEIEDSNLRLFSKKSNGKTDDTVILFRLGTAGFLRVCENQIVYAYNSSVSTVGTTTP